MSSIGTLLQCPYPGPVSLLVIVCVNRATIVNVSHIVIAQCMPKGLYGDGLCAEMDYFKSGI